jgi:hypothetical protein
VFDARCATTGTTAAISRFGETSMTNDDLRSVRRRLREGHQKLFDLQGAQIAALQEALMALSRSHDEIVTLMQADNDLEDLTDENPPPAE